MIVIALADIHGETENLDHISDALSTADVVLLAGDITNLAGEMAPLLEAGA